MKHRMLEIKWGLIFSLFTLIWMWLEKFIGLHDTYIDKHAVYTNFIAIPAVAIYFLALREKRERQLNGAMTFKEGFQATIVITLVVTLLAPLCQWLIHSYITPNYFANIKSHLTQNGQMTIEDADRYFSLKSYMTQSVIGTPIMGVITGLIAAWFSKRNKTVTSK